MTNPLFTREHQEKAWQEAGAVELIRVPRDRVSGAEAQVVVREISGRPSRGSPPQALELPGSGGNDGGMEARISRIEDSLGNVRERLAKIEAQMEHVATKAWILGGVVVVLLGTLGVAWWLVQQYLSPILQAASHH